VNAQFFMVWRLRNQLEKDSLLEELTALLPKRDLEAIYEEAFREPYSFLYIYLLNHRDAMFHVRFERMFQIQDGNLDAAEKDHDDHLDSRRRVAGTDSDFEFDVGETVHLQGSARLGVFKIRVADTFLSTDRGTYLYWKDTALATLNWAQLPTGAYTGVRLAAWISSNFAAATYVESRNELEVAHDGNRLILNDQELRTQFPGSGSYAQGATPSKPLSINHLLGPSFINEVYLRCSSLANAADTVGPLGHDIIAKIVCKQGVGHVMEADTHENHMVNVRGPITLRYLRFKLTDYEGNVVNLRGTSLSFCVYLDGASARAHAGHDEGHEAVLAGGTMMSIEPRNEQQMLRQFWKKYPSYNLNALMRKRYEELMDAKAFNEWVANRRLKQEGEDYADAMGRAAEAVNRRVPQLRWAGAERRQVLRAAQQVAALEYIEEGEPLKLPLPDRRPSFLGPGPDTDSEGPDKAGRGGPARRGRGRGADCGTAADIEQFAAEQAAAETAEITPLLAETAAETAGLAQSRRAQRRPWAARRQPSWRPKLRSLALREPAERFLPGDPKRARRRSRLGAAELQRRRAACLRARGQVLRPSPRLAQRWEAWARQRCMGLGMGAMGGAYQGARYMLGGNGGDAASSSGSEFQDIRTLNNMQQGTPQERFSVWMPFGLNPVAQTSSGSESYAPIRRPRPQRAEPSFNELRREALSREPEVTNAVNDELISSLDYKMRTSNASYVIARKDVQFYPSSLSTFTPTSSRVARIPLTTGGDFLDPESIKIAFRFVNNDATNDFNPIMGHPACLIKRIQLFANGQHTDDIDNYARSVHLYTLLKPREWWINQANEGFEINEVSNFPQPLPESHFREVLMAPTLVGLLGCGKLLPPQLNLVLEIEFADPADVARGGTNSSVDYDIQNVRVLASQVTLDSALVESFNRVLLSGRSLVFSYPTVSTQVTSVPAGSTEFNVTVSRAFTKLLGAFVTFRTLADQSNVAALNHPGTQADGTSFLESQMALGPMQVPHYPQKDFAEHLHFLSILACTYDSSIRNMRLTKNMFEGSSFIAAFPVQRVPGMPLSGISTRSGDLARFSFKGLQADKVQQCYVHLVSYQVENMSLFESSITGNVLNDGSTTEISGITAGQLATVLTAYTPQVDTAANTAAIGINTAGVANNAAAIAALQTQVDNLPAPAPPDLAPYALASDLAAAEGLIAANASSITALNTWTPRAASVDAKLASYSATAAMNSAITSANNATLASVASNYALRTVTDQLALDLVAKQSGLDVDTKIANALLDRPSTADLTAAVNLKTTPADVDQRVTTALLTYVTQVALDAALALRDGRHDAAEASIAALQAAGFQTAAQVASAIATALLPYTDTTGLNSLLAARDGRLDSAEASVAALQAAGFQTSGQVASAIATALLPYVQQTGLDAALALRDGRLDAHSAIDAILAQPAALTTGGGSNLINAQAWSGEITWDLLLGTNTLRNLHFNAPLSVSLQNDNFTLSLACDSYSIAQADAAIAAALVPYETAAQRDAAIAAALLAYSTTAEMDAAIAAALVQYYTSVQVDTQIASAIAGIDLTPYYTSTHVGANRRRHYGGLGARDLV
ncbi:unnamed protein product, partial [Symbiodinium microadriaticum]